MRATFDFRSVGDAADCHTMFVAFGWPCTLDVDTTRPVHRLIVNQYEPSTFGAQAGEAAVFAPVQITVE